MKWAVRKKKLSSSPSSSPSSSSIISRVFPLSWFSKSKQKGANFETISDKNNKKFDFDFPTVSSKGRFYSMDEDDPYWRLSFGEERIIPARRSTGGITTTTTTTTTTTPVWYDYDYDHEFRFPVSSFGARELDVPNREQCSRNFSEMVLDIKKRKEMEKNKRMKDVVRNGHISRKFMSPSVVRSKQEELERVSNSGERDIFAVENDSMVRMEEDFGMLKLSNSRKHPEIRDYAATSDTTSVSERKLNMESKNAKDIKVKTNKKNKVKAYSPRTECKIRAIEEMKRARMRMRKEKRKEEKIVVEGKTVFDSFAVVKNSFDPRKDFRDSMVEMIREKGIRRSEDLEELLACYLALNSDEYHDIIVKVFRQVWLELKGVQYFGY